MELTFYYRIDAAAGLGVDKETGEKVDTFATIGVDVKPSITDDDINQLEVDYMNKYIVGMGGFSPEHVKPISREEYLQEADLS
ncbi:hypothetical protein [Erysipelothrix tonsillarum]|uniref:hypothetical protein n=1 Tax=Erysipelothrix tonsillarum TaxID=38402 RepID=UPI0039C83C28